MSNEDDTVIRVEAVSHRHGTTVALRDASFSVRAGAAVACVGPDGAGKSTLLSLIAGVRRIQAGAVSVLGQCMSSRGSRDAVAARVAYVPQGLGRNLYPMLSVVENIDFFGRLYGQPASGRRIRINRLLEATGLDPFRRRLAGQLSGGMRQKLGLCCALVHEPDLLILDEPTTGVDPLSRRQFWELVQAIRRERGGMTLLSATAYMEEAERFSDIVALDQGRILAAGTTVELLAGSATGTLEDAYMALQESGRRADRTPLVIPPLPKADGPPAISAENLTMRFGDFTAVDHVSFRIAKGEIFGFLGSNGCGKTTTMKMLTGLLPATEGRAEMLGTAIDARNMASRLRIGYMSQSFSLYTEMSVRANLQLHASLFGIPVHERGDRVAAALTRFGLEPYARDLPSALPLGMRQRLQFAAACLHKPEVLILDEPTSGVDPAARDAFWRLLVEMSRRDGVTIFIATHFMNEAARCDRISLMHAGRVLAVGSPEELRLRKNATSLEDAFVAYLQTPSVLTPSASSPTLFVSVAAKATASARKPLLTSLGRSWAFAHGEALELLRDPIRLPFSLLGPLILLIAFGFGISFDVDSLPYATLDRDQSLESRLFLESLSGSRYFSQQDVLRDDTEVDRRLRSGDLRFVVEIPPGFGRDLLQGRRPQVSIWLDGSNPFQAETARAYVDGIAMAYLADRYRRAHGRSPEVPPGATAPRFWYNQEVRSVLAIVPGAAMFLLMLIPSMLTAVAVVREKELGSITNLQASPATIGEYLVGKQLPYVAVGLANIAVLLATGVLVFGVIPTGSLLFFVVAAILYVVTATAFGLLVSAFVRTQIAAIFATSILVVIPAINFSGLLYPASALEGGAKLLGLGFPSLWFQAISLGVFAKGLDGTAFTREVAVLAGFAVAFLLLASLCMRKQDT